MQYAPVVSRTCLRVYNKCKIPHTKNSESKVKCSGVDNEDGSDSCVSSFADVGSPDEDLDPLHETVDSVTHHNKVCTN